MLCSIKSSLLFSTIETFLTGGPDTQTLIPNIKLSSESFLGTGCTQMPSAEVIRSISIDNDNEGYHNNQTGIFIIDSKEDIGKFLDFLQFGFQTFSYSSHVLGVTNFSCEEIWDTFESYCINPK